VSSVPEARTGGTSRPTRVLVVGSGWRFTSGISYYTCRLANAFAERTTTSVVLMRRLVPRFLYPGRSRVGSVVNDVDYSPDIDVYDGVDWYWGRSARGVSGFLDRTRPDVVVLQWWTGAVLHSYLLLARALHRRGAKVVIEWHEVQDTGEARVPGVVRYVRSAMKALLRRVDAHVVHSEYDSELLQGAYGLGHPARAVRPRPRRHRGARRDRHRRRTAPPAVLRDDPPVQGARGPRRGVLLVAPGTGGEVPAHHRRRDVGRVDGTAGRRAGQPER
jgi:glycosyltransferase involved in cell wall biosynthesis